MKSLALLTDLSLTFGAFKIFNHYYYLISNINFSNKILISLTKILKLYHT